MRNDSETRLSPAEIRDLRCIAGLMIPRSVEFGLPAADDAIIFADIVTSLGRDLDEVRKALGGFAELASGPFAELDAARQQAVAASFRARGGMQAATLSRVILQCYYRDDRVVRSLGLEPRAPFPNAHAGTGRLVAARSGARAPEDVARCAVTMGVRVARLIGRTIISPNLHRNIGVNIQGPSLTRVPDPSWGKVVCTQWRLSPVAARGAMQAERRRSRDRAHDTGDPTHGNDRGSRL